MPEFTLRDPHGILPIRRHIQYTKGLVLEWDSKEKCLVPWHWQFLFYFSTFPGFPCTDGLSDLGRLKVAVALHSPNLQRIDQAASFATRAASALSTSWIPNTSLNQLPP
jgi:hypothetical protein